MIMIDAVISYPDKNLPSDPAIMNAEPIGTRYHIIPIADDVDLKIARSYKRLPKANIPAPTNKITAKSLTPN